MTHSASLLAREKRRHRVISCCLAIGAIVGSVLATNERALFMPVNAPSATAFATAFGPVTDVHPKTAGGERALFDSFDVTADSRDLRQGLTEPGGDEGTPTNGDGPSIIPLLPPALSPDEIVSAGGPRAADDKANPVPQSADDGTRNTIPPFTFGTPSGIAPGDIRTGTASSISPSSAVPEPSIWLMWLVGFSAVGCTLRTARRREIDSSSDAGIS